ncbi:Major facilitator superfamily,Major facilitator superfamily domain [Cinara cedri]|uniref:Major facilitator superfamily,Major facilitator superfamily domain n=1 Tax=Cinara cedri TaxID=506608 RepID=A0A5E4MZE2_9HEMI|nr:Major facilitator superfamily,Major facilitator superfamily domain [Cinara cedri]
MALATSSIQEPTIDNELSVPTTNVKNKFRLTLEPIMILILIGVKINLMIQTNLFEERVCLHTSLGKNKSVNCYNMTNAEKRTVQPDVAKLQMFANLIETLSPSISALFLGSWSDINGRLPLFIVTISGIVLSNCMYCVISAMPELSPIFFLVCSLPIALSGGRAVLYLAAYCYIVDITDVQTRAFRFGVLQSCTAFGSILGSIMSPYLCNKSYTYAFTTSSICATAGLLYTSIYLKETIVIKEDVNKNLFRLNLVRDTWQTVLKPRFGYLRCIILISVMIITIDIIDVFGELSIIYLYLQKQFSWTLENYTLFNAYSTLISALLPAISLYVFSTKLKISDIHLAITSTGFKIIHKIGLAYSVYGWNFYVVQIVGSLIYSSETLVRSQLSKIFPSEDLGKIYAFINVMEDFGILLGTPIYTTLYNMTIDNFANCFLFLSSILETFILMLYLFMLSCLSKSTQPDHLLTEN